MANRARIMKWWLLLLTGLPVECFLASTLKLLCKVQWATTSSLLTDRMGPEELVSGVNLIKLDKSSIISTIFQREGLLLIKFNLMKFIDGNRWIENLLTEF